jgi:hypothetical protein
MGESLTALVSLLLLDCQRFFKRGFGARVFLVGKKDQSELAFDTRRAYNLRKSMFETLNDAEGSRRVQGRIDLMEAGRSADPNG